MQVNLVIFLSGVSKEQLALSICLTSILLSACEVSSDMTNNGDVVCTEEYILGITIEVIDKITGELIACGVNAIIEDTGYSEEITSFSSGVCDYS